MAEPAVALAQALLCVTSVGCALRARQVTAGPAAGFLLQALVAAADALAPRVPSVPSVPSVPPEEAPPGSWICSVLAQPLVAFGCHRLSGDSATAALLLATGAAVAAVAAALPAGGRGVAGHGVTALTATSLLALATLTGSRPGAAAALLVALGDALVALGDAAVAPWAEPVVRAAASVALLGTLLGTVKGTLE